LDEWHGIEILKFIFGMPKLTEITFDLINTEKTIDWENVNLPQNPSITSFYLESYAPSNDYIKMFNTLFDALPNLKILSLEVIKNKCLESIGVRCKNLEEIDVQTFNVTDLPDPNCFPKIKKFQCADCVQKRLKQRINMKPVADRTNFEKLILAAVPSYNISQKL
jgi:Leucine-rich repeat (LRR) protein